MHTWGAALVRAAAAAATTATSGGSKTGAHAAVPAQKIPDPSSSQLTYWTDNGAYYDFYAYEPNIASKGVPQDVLVALADTFKNGSYPGKPLPVKGFMLDAYWMYNVRSNGNCKINDTFAPVPFPRPASSPQCSSNTTRGFSVPLFASPRVPVDPHAGPQHARWT